MESKFHIRSEMCIFNLQKRHLQRKNMKDFWKSLTTFQKVKFVFSATIGLMVILFAILNWKQTEVHLLFGKVSLPKTILIVLSIAGGFGWATLFGMRRSRKKDKQITILETKLQTLSKKTASIEEKQ